METVGEAMRFVANPLKQFQMRRCPLAVAGPAPGPVDLLEFLGEPDDRLLEKAEALKFLARAGKLPLAAIDDDQIGQAEGLRLPL